MINNVVLMGQLTADPETRTTSSGVEVTPFTVAVERDYVKPGEERQTDFIRCVAWRQTATFLCRYFHKGEMIAIQGNLQTRSYEDKNGNKHTMTEVIVNEISFCGNKTNVEQSSAPNTNDSASEISDNDIDADDGLPF